MPCGNMEVYQLIQSAKANCCYRGEIREVTKSTYCKKLDQWISSKYCDLCQIPIEEAQAKFKADQLKEVMMNE
jgi:hypothetical protein